MRLKIAAVMCVGIAVVGFSAGCSRFAATPSATPTPLAASQESTASTATVLGAVEVSQYKGKPLDKAADAPENSIKGPQHIDRNTYRLSITGLVDNPVKLTYAQVTSMPSYQKVTTLNCVEGWSRTWLWQGVRIKDLLTEAGYRTDAKTVIFRSYDGYSTSLPLSSVIDKNLLLAYRMNGKELLPERGFPFQVVAEDRLGYKWAKWVTEIEVSSDANFKGYWEQRGYDNDAKLPAAP